MLKYILGYMIFVLIRAFNDRNRVYALAESYARSVNKPLVVVGGFNHQIMGFDLPISAHGSGDLCIDIDPKACLNANFIQADIRDIPLPDKYAGAVYCSHVLEHLPTITDAEMAYNELQRISDMVFIIFPDRFSVSAWLHPDHHLWIYEKNGEIIFEQR